MRLPYRENAIISPSKLKDYLLSETHPDGSSKAKFFRPLGFDETNLDVLEERLKAIVYTGDVTKISFSPYGTKYVVDGILSTPSGKVVQVRTVWIIHTEDNIPRFVTSYPR